MTDRQPHVVTGPAPRELDAEVWLPLVQEALAQRGHFTLPLRGNSMVPTLPQACEIDVVPLTAPPRLGDVIVFASGEALVAHRLVQRRGTVWIAQGDNRRAPDAALRPSRVLGVVSAARLADRRIWPRRGERAWTVLWLARYHCLRPVRWAVRWARRQRVR
jgi:hypothetical protein